MADDDDDDSISINDNISISDSPSNDTLSIWGLSGSSDNDLQSLSSDNSSSDNVDSISSTGTNSYLNNVSNISSPLSNLSDVSNSLESFPDTCNSVLETINDLQSPNLNLSQSKELSVVDRSLSTKHSDSTCATDYDKEVSTAKDHYKSVTLEEAARSLDCDFNKLTEYQQKKMLRQGKFLQQSKKDSECKSEKGLLKSSKSENVATKAGTRQERHVTNSINSSIVQKGSLLGTGLNKNGNSVSEEEPNSLLSLLDDLPEGSIPFEEFVVKDKKWPKIISSDDAVKSDAEVALNKCKVLLTEGVASQDDGAIQTLEDLLAAKTKSLDLEQKTPDVLLVEKSTLKSVFDVNIRKYTSDVSKEVHSLLGMDGTYNQHLTATNDQMVMHATLCFDDLQYVPSELILVC